MIRYIDDYIGNRENQAGSFNAEMVLGFNRLKELSKNLANADFDEIIKLLNKETYGVFTGRTLKKGETICRGRSHVNGTSFFLSEKEISYISSPDIVKNMNYYGRANKPSQSIFYGSIPSEEIPALYLTPVFECSGSFRNKTISHEPKEEIITCGLWKVIKDFDVAELVYSSDAIKNWVYAQKRFEYYKEQLNKIPDNSLKALGLEILIFISDEFAKKDIRSSQDYKISAAYSDIIWSKLQLAGILFPSVQSDYKSFNIALQPEAVDKYLTFQKAVMVRLKKEGKKVFMEDYYTLKHSKSREKYFVWQKCKTIIFDVCHFFMFLLTTTPNLSYHYSEAIFIRRLELKNGLRN